MPEWQAIEQAEPQFAARVRRLFDAGRHKTIATLRADGSPRVSGIECEFADGELWGIGIRYHKDEMHDDFEGVPIIQSERNVLTSREMIAFVKADMKEVGL